MNKSVKLLWVILIAVMLFPFNFINTFANTEKSVWNDRNAWKYPTSNRRIEMADYWVQLTHASGNFPRLTDSDVNTTIDGNTIRFVVHFNKPVTIRRFKAEIYNPVKGISFVNNNDKFLKSISYTDPDGKFQHYYDINYTGQDLEILIQGEGSNVLILRRFDITYSDPVTPPKPTPTPQPTPFPDVDIPNIPNIAGSLDTPISPSLENDLSSLTTSSANILANNNQESGYISAMNTNVFRSSQYPDLKFIQNSFSWVNDIELDFSHATLAGGTDALNVSHDGTVASLSTISNINSTALFQGNLSFNKKLPVQVPTEWQCIAQSPPDSTGGTTCRAWGPRFTGDFAEGNDASLGKVIVFPPMSELKEIAREMVSLSKMLSSPLLTHEEKAQAFDTLLRYQKLYDSNSNLRQDITGSLATSGYIYTPKHNSNGTIISSNRDIQFDGVRYSYTRETTYTFNIVTPDNQYVNAVLNVPVSTPISGISTTVGQAYITGSNTIELRNTNNFTLHFKETITNSDNVYVNNLSRMVFDVLQLSYSKGSPVYDHELWKLMSSGKDGVTENYVSNNDNTTNSFNSAMDKENAISNQVQDGFTNALNNVDISNPLTGNPSFANSAKWVSRQFTRLTHQNAFGTILGFALILGLALAVIGRMLR